MANITVDQALALIKQEIAKTTGANKNSATRNASNLSIQITRLGIGGNVVIAIKDPPKKASGRRSPRRSKPKDGPKSASDTTGRRG